MVLVLGADDVLLILKRPDWVSWAPGQWGLPGGAIEKGETPLQAATREAKEETMLELTNLRDVKLLLDKGLFAYYTRDYSGIIQIDHEHEDWTWVRRHEIENYDLAPNLLSMYDWVLNHG
jgi:8-oxo-dGTP pyrophosphatase MutT (NUDIX family)